MGERKPITPATVAAVAAENVGHAYQGATDWHRRRPRA
jgi:hypothetical protein